MILEIYDQEGLNCIQKAWTVYPEIFEPERLAL